MTDEAEEDERDIELASLQAIYPELEVTDGESCAVSLEIEVAPSKKLATTFDAPTPYRTHTLPTPPSSDGDGNHAEELPEVVAAHDTHELEYLPSLQLEIELPQDYPEGKPPAVRLRTEPAWVPEDVLGRLTKEAYRLWEEYDHSQVLFAYIDYLQQEAEQAFTTSFSAFHLPHSLKTPLLDYSRMKALRKFNESTFDCGICLEPKKGSSCYRLQSCAHVFCSACLSDYYNAAITEGDVSTIRCLDPTCTHRKTLHPRELLAIPLPRPQVQRYVDLKLKKKLDSDKTTVFCPRKFCQAPARSPKYAKYTANPSDLENYPDSDDEQEPTPTEDSADDGFEKTTPSATPADRLHICSSCTYAFCALCTKSWHGDLIACRPSPTDPAALSPEDAASYDFIRLNTSPCPTCYSSAQKTHGCNHMICYTCGTHFCYLCSAWLDKQNPYRHFNTRSEGCYMRLWELEEGDEGIGEEGQGRGRNEIFGGARAAEQAQMFAMMLEQEQGQGRDQQQQQQQAQPVPRENRQQPAAQQRRAPERQQAPQQARRQPAAQVRRQREPHAVDPGLQRFLQLAANDEEDGWDSDEMEGEVLWA